MGGQLSRIIPENFTNLIGLARKLVRSKNPAGRAAMWYSFLGLLMIPLDWVFKHFEQKLYKKSSKSELPLIFVCGPPRSGTTVVSQVLIKHLPVYYFNNLTSIFPNSPIISNKIFGRFFNKSNQNISFNSLYGRTSQLWEPNDALYLWDRWTGTARNEIPESLKSKDKIQGFFAAVNEFSGLPLVNKVNRLNTFADKVAQVLDNAYFVCLDRNPVYLAQSELIASRFIHSDEKTSYGVKFDADEKAKGEQQSLDSIEKGCNQVIQHKKMMLKQQNIVGIERFMIVPYEDFCANPAKWVCKMSNKFLGQTLNYKDLEQALPPLKNSNTIKIELEKFHRIEKFFKTHKTFNNTIPNRKII